MIPDSERLVCDGGSEVLVETDGNESTPRAVLRGIAALEGMAETDLDTLYDEVEPEALEMLIQHSDRYGCFVGVESRSKAIPSSFGGPN